MLVRFFLLCYFGPQIFAKRIKDVNVSCLIMALENVQCNWNGHGINYSFHSWFNDEAPRECSAYILENGNVTGCKQIHDNLRDARFDPFTTTLTNGNFSLEKLHELTAQVKLNPPVNLTMTTSSEHQLFLYWNHTWNSKCVQSEVRYRNNGNAWQSAILPSTKGNIYSVLPSLSIDNYYELQVRSRVGALCSESLYWSEWSHPIYWESTNKKKNPGGGSRNMALLIPGLLVPVILIVMVIMLRPLLRVGRTVILVPAYVHNFPGDGNLTEWLRIPPEIKKGFDAKYEEFDCSVREYRQVPQSPSESGRSDCISMPTDQSEPSSISASSSSSSVLSIPEMSSEEQGEV